MDKQAQMAPDLMIEEQSLRRGGAGRSGHTWVGHYGWRAEQSREQERATEQV